MPEHDPQLSRALAKLAEIKRWAQRNSTASVNIGRHAAAVEVLAMIDGSAGLNAVPALEGRRRREENHE